LNIVRIPVGYWSYVNPWGPYTQGAAPYLDKAITWARKTRLKVIIDLHGAPKSQNGFDHSGRKQANPQWGDADSIAYTHQTLRILNEKYAKPDMQDVVVAIQPLNEPIVAKIPTDTVRRFYRDAFYNLRQVSDTPIVLHDGFKDPSWMNGFLTPQDNNAQGVVVDHHEYQVFGDGLASLSVDQHLGMACDAASLLPDILPQSIHHFTDSDPGGYLQHLRQMDHRGRMVRRADRLRKAPQRPRRRQPPRRLPPRLLLRRLLRRLVWARQGLGACLEGQRAQVHRDAA
jgi:aryl-phospho-beta-D-glucosidase BglC (GH1 family)